MIQAKTISLQNYSLALRQEKLRESLKLRKVKREPRVLLNNAGKKDVKY